MSLLRRALAHSFLKRRVEDFYILQIIESLSAGKHGRWDFPVELDISYIHRKVVRHVRSGLDTKFYYWDFSIMMSPTGTALIAYKVQRVPQQPEKLKAARLTEKELKELEDMPLSCYF